MNKKRIAIIVFAVLSLLNFIVGGTMGFILSNSEHRKTFTIIFFVCVVSSIVSLVCGWVIMKQAESRKEYKVMKLCNRRFVAMTRRMEPDIEGLRALQMGITGWAFSIMVLFFAFGIIWSDTMWLFSFNVLATIFILITTLTEFVTESIIVIRKKKRGEAI